ncbi:MAG: 50S ribosomal protein L18 [Rickettsiales bacterium]
MQLKSFRLEKRKQRIRNVINKKCIVPTKKDLAHARHRMSITKSNRHLYVQIIDMNNNGNVICSMSTLIYRNEEKKFNKSYCNKTYAAKLGSDLITKAVEHAEIQKLTIDRGGNKYTGNIHVLVESARNTWKAKRPNAENKAPF